MKMNSAKWSGAQSEIAEIVLAEVRLASAEDLTAQPGPRQLAGRVRLGFVGHDGSGQSHRSGLRHSLHRRVFLRYRMLPRPRAVRCSSDWLAIAERQHHHFPNGSALPVPFNDKILASGCDVSQFSECLAFQQHWPILPRPG